MNKHSRQGFTLIELLLIIAILAVISALMLSAYQQRANNLKVQKTALQIQQLLQAASAYYRDANAWPTMDNATFKNNYLPVGLQNNPWGTGYTYGIFNQTFKIYSGILPNTQLVNRISSLLPNAEPDPIYHREVMLTLKPQTSTFIIKTIYETPQLCDSEYGSGCKKSYTFSMNCPTGIPKVSVYAKSVYADFLSGGDYVGANEISRLDTNAASCSTPDQQGNSQCTIQVRLSTRHGVWSHDEHALGTGSFTYIGYCYENS